MSQTTLQWSQLRDQASQAGCFEYRPWRAVAALLANWAGAAALFALASQGGLWLLAFAPASLLFYRLGWLMHDGAHGAVFGQPKADRVFTLVACLALGEFASGWQYGHNRHHGAPNVRGVDGDQSERWSAAHTFDSKALAAVTLFWLVRVGKLWLPKSLILLGLRDGVYAYRHRRDRFAAELAVVLISHTLQIAGFCWLFGAAGPLAWLVNTHLGMVYLNAVFAGNHYDLPSFDAGAQQHIDFAKLQILTSRNYQGGWLVRFLCGGLEHQIEHHLFPTMPRHGTLRAEPLVRRYCTERGLPYRELPLLASLARVPDFHLHPLHDRLIRGTAAQP